MGNRRRVRYPWISAVSVFLGIALAVPAAGAAQAATPAANLNGAVAAFEASNSYLYLCDVPLGGCNNTGLGMEAGASPTVYSEDNGLVWAAFEANTQKLYVTEQNKNGAVKKLNTGLDIANLTTPAITEYYYLDGGGNTQKGIVVAFHGTNGNLDLYNYDIGQGTGSWVNTGLAMYPGTSPAVAGAGQCCYVATIVEVAFANSANHIGVYGTVPLGGNSYSGSSSVATTLGMLAGTSPSVTAVSYGDPSTFSLAFNDNQSQLYLAYFHPDVTAQSQMQLENIGKSIVQGSGPSLPVTKNEGNATNEVSVYDNPLGGGGLCAWNDSSGQENCFNDYVDGTPAVALVNGTYWAAYESPVTGHFRAYNTATGTYYEQPMYNGTNAALSS